MKPGITAKLFLAVFATGVLVALVMAVAGRVGFRMDFSHYAREVETGRVKALAQVLGEVYERDGGWGLLAEKSSRWQAFIRRQARLLDMGDGPMPPPQMMGGRHPRGAHLGQRLALIAADGTVIAGKPNLPADAPSVPVIAGDRTVGRLAWLPFERPVEAVDVRFHAAQWRTLLVAILAALLIAGVAAWFLSRLFLAPARRIGAATHRLAAGDYGTRVSAGSGDEFGQLAQDFNLLARTLERNEAARRAFTADVAHELRTPLSILRGELDAVEDGVRPWNGDTLRSIQAEVASLAKLVGDLYDLSLSDAGALSYQKEDLDLREVIGDVTGAARERFAGRGLELIVRGTQGPAIPLLADPGRLGQMFNNLLENCLRYTDPPGRVEVSCTLGNAQASIEFADSAPGVPAGSLPRLFDRLYRVEGSRSREHGGAGLGLAIARNIAEAHGGSIRAEASALGGVAVTVTLPVARSRPGVEADA